MSNSRERGLSNRCGLERRRIVYRGDRPRAIACCRWATPLFLCCLDCCFALRLGGAVTGVLQGEEAGAAPGRAGDVAGDGRQACICRSLPLEALAPDRDGVALALVIANEHRAGFKLASARVATSREAVQKPQTVAVKAAEGPLLDVQGDHATEKARAQARRRRAAETRSPHPPQPIPWERLNASDFGGDRGRIGCRLAHNLSPRFAGRRSLGCRGLLGSNAIHA